jgi:hypothetical protein
MSYRDRVTGKLEPGFQGRVQDTQACIQIPHGVVVTPLDGGYELTAKDCVDKSWDRNNGATAEIEWDLVWTDLGGGWYRGEIRFKTALMRPYKIAVSGYTSPGLDMSDIWLEHAPGAKVEAISGDDGVLGVGYSTVYQLVEIYPEYNQVNDVVKLVFTTDREVEGQQGFGFASVRAECTEPAGD